MPVTFSLWLSISVLAWKGMKSILFTVASMGCILDLSKDFIYGFLQKAYGVLFICQLAILLALNITEMSTLYRKLKSHGSPSLSNPPASNPFLWQNYINQALFGKKWGKQVKIFSKHLAELLLQNCLKVSTSTQSQNLTKGVRCSHSTLWKEIQHSSPSHNFSLQCNYKGQITEFLCIFPSVKDQPKFEPDRSETSLLSIHCWNNLFLLPLPILVSSIIIS